MRRDQGMPAPLTSHQRNLFMTKRRGGSSQKAAAAAAGISVRSAEGDLGPPDLPKGTTIIHNVSVLKSSAVSSNSSDIYAAMEEQLSTHSARSMSVRELEQSLGTFIEQLGRLSEQQVKHFIRRAAPLLFVEMEKAARGEATSHQLQTSSRLFVYYMDNPEYEAVIQRYDSKLRFPILDYSQSTFVGMGQGAGGPLASFRKVRLKNDDVFAFEKIYELGSRPYQRMRWFYRHIFHQFPNNYSVAAPSILAKTQGRYFSALYFQFMPELIRYPDLVCRPRDLRAKSLELLQD